MKKILSFIIIIALIFSSFGISIFADEEIFGEEIVDEEIVDEEIYENEDIDDMPEFDDIFGGLTFVDDDEFDIIGEPEVTATPKPTDDPNATQKPAETAVPEVTEAPSDVTYSLFDAEDYTDNMKTMTYKYEGEKPLTCWENCWGINNDSYNGNLGITQGNKYLIEFDVISTGKSGSWLYIDWASSSSYNSRTNCPSYASGNNSRLTGFIGVVYGNAGKDHLQLGEYHSNWAGGSYDRGGEEHGIYHYSIIWDTVNSEFDITLTYGASSSYHVTYSYTPTNIADSDVFRFVNFDGTNQSNSVYGYAHIKDLTVYEYNISYRKNGDWILTGSWNNYLSVNSDAHSGRMNVTTGNVYMITFDFVAPNSSWSWFIFDWANGSAVSKSNCTGFKSGTDPTGYEKRYSLGEIYDDDSHTTDCISVGAYSGSFDDTVNRNNTNLTYSYTVIWDTVNKTFDITVDYEKNSTSQSITKSWTYTNNIDDGDVWRFCCTSTSSIVRDFTVYDVTEPASLGTPTTFFEDWSDISSASATAVDSLSGTHEFASATAGDWRYRTGNIAGWYTRYLEGSPTSNNNGTLTLNYADNYEGKTLEIITGMNIGHASITVADYKKLTAAEIASYVSHYGLRVWVGVTEVTTLLTAEQIGNSDGANPVIRYKLENLPEGDLTIKATGDWNHKLFTIEVKEPDTTLTTFIDNFSEINRYQQSFTTSTIPHNAKFWKSENLWLWQYHDNHNTSAFDSDQISKVEGIRDGTGTTYIMYKGDFAGLRARFALALGDGDYRTSFGNIYPCSNLIWTKWDCMRQDRNLQNYVKIYAGATEDSMTEADDLYWEGTSRNGFIAFAVNTAALPANTHYLKFVLADISHYEYKILSCATFSDVYTSSQVTTIDGIGYMSTDDVWYNYNDNVMNVDENIYLNDFPFVNAYVNTRPNSKIIKTSSSDPRETKGDKIFIAKPTVTASSGVTAVRNARTLIHMDDTGTNAQRYSTTIDTTRGLYGVLVGYNVQAGETTYTARYRRTDRNERNTMTHEFNCVGLSGNVNFGLTFNHHDGETDIEFIGDVTDVVGSVSPSGAVTKELEYGSYFTE